VAVEAATCLAALSDHAGAVKDRLEAGHFAATPEKVALNPVQEAAGELEGLFRCLRIGTRTLGSARVCVGGGAQLAGEDRASVTI
jgi:hypothetical protein